MNSAEFANNAEHNRIKAKLEKLNAKVVKTTHNPDRIFVIYNHKGKTKLAYFNLTGHYYDRYGPSVISTFNGASYWFLSNDVANSVTDIEMEEMKLVHEGKSTLPNFDVSVLGELTE